MNCASPSWFCPLSLHDALPIWQLRDALRRAGRDAAQPAGADELQHRRRADRGGVEAAGDQVGELRAGDRKSTRLNSSHSQISYAVFCLKKKKNTPPVSFTVICF